MTISDQTGFSFVYAHLLACHGCEESTLVIIESEKK